MMPTPVFVKLSMFIDQNSRGRSNSSQSAAMVIPFKRWRVGYVLVSERAAAGDEWTIKTIESPDGQPHRENCTITLINASGELRLVKGSTAQSTYQFKSTGDAEPPPQEERADVKPIVVSVIGIREFYPRSHGNEGTRILMHDKTAYIVAEPFGYVLEQVQIAGLVVGSHSNGVMVQIGAGA